MLSSCYIDLNEYPNLATKAVLTQEQNWCAVGSYDYSTGTYTAGVPNVDKAMVQYGDNGCWQGIIGPATMIMPNSGTFVYAGGSKSDTDGDASSLIAISEARQIQNKIASVITSCVPTIPLTPTINIPTTLVPNKVYTYTNLTEASVDVSAKLTFDATGYTNPEKQQFILMLGEQPTGQNPVPVPINFRVSPGALFELKGGALASNVYIVCSGQIQMAQPATGMTMYGNMITFGSSKQPALDFNALPGSAALPIMGTNMYISYLAPNTTLYGRICCCGSPLVLDNNVKVVGQPNIICYAKGTQILTTQGYKKIEDLKLGENISTQGTIHNNKVSIDTQDSKPLTWMSSFKIEHMTEEAYPVCVKKGALGYNSPFADLYVSQDHSFLRNGKMISAKDLCNGKTIFKEKRFERIEYFHFELPKHSVVNANGALSESFLSNKERKDLFEPAPELKIKSKHSSLKTLRI